MKDDERKKRKRCVIDTSPVKVAEKKRKATTTPPSLQREESCPMTSPSYNITRCSPDELCNRLRVLVSSFHKPGKTHQKQEIDAIVEELYKREIIVFAKCKSNFIKK